MIKILFFDIETAPNVAFSWGKYDQTIPAFKKEWYILSFAYKWLGEPVKSFSLPDFPLYKTNKTNDRDLVRKLHKLLDEADVVVAHNATEFDIKRAKARFLIHKLKPGNYKTIDTLKVLKRNFSFNSNKLNDVCQQLKLGKKVEHEGIGLWIKCMEGDSGSWKTMVKYNKRDVVLLERLYLYLLPWLGNSINHAIEGDKICCPKCGSTKIQKRGYGLTITGKFRKFQCISCGGWGRFRQNERVKKVLVSN